MCVDEHRSFKGSGHVASEPEKSFSPNGVEHLLTSLYCSGGASCSSLQDPTVQVWHVLVISPKSGCAQNGNPARCRCRCVQSAVQLLWRGQTASILDCHEDSGAGRRPREVQPHIHGRALLRLWHIVHHARWQLVEVVPGLDGEGRPEVGHLQMTVVRMMSNCDVVQRTRRLSSTSKLY